MLSYCLLYEGKVAAEATTGPVIRGVVELGVATHTIHRRKGYATLACAKLIQECQAHGYKTYWNTNIANIPSIALARKLGYVSEKKYRLLAWSPL